MHTIYVASSNRKSDLDSYPRLNFEKYIERLIFFVISWSFSMLILSETLSNGSALIFSTLISLVVVIILFIGQWE
jgi:hypothetical protein